MHCPARRQSVIWSFKEKVLCMTDSWTTWKEFARTSCASLSINVPDNRNFLRTVSKTCISDLNRVGATVYWILGNVHSQLYVNWALL